MVGLDGERAKLLTESNECGGVYEFLYRAFLSQCRTKNQAQDRSQHLPMRAQTFGPIQKPNGLNKVQNTI